MRDFPWRNGSRRAVDAFLAWDDPTYPPNLALIVPYLYRPPDADDGAVSPQKEGPFIPRMNDGGFLARSL